MSRIKFMNTMIDNLTMEEALRRIDELIQEDRNAYVVTPNVDHIVRLETDKELQNAYNNADLILTDGKPLIWISNWYGTPIKEKISGSDLFPKLCEMASNKEYKMFFLGAMEGVAQKAADRLKQRFPKLIISGTYSPRVGFENDEEEINRIITQINQKQPHILIVSLGCPKQEIFINKYRTRLKVPISIGLGATLDFEAGVVRRSPSWISELGFEWLFRMTQDPKRLIKRYLIDDVKIIGMAYKYKKGRRVDGYSS